jgi:hypothetical protein
MSVLGLGTFLALLPVGMVVGAIMSAIYRRFGGSSRWPCRKRYWRRIGRRTWVNTIPRGERRRDHERLNLTMQLTPNGAHT